MNLLEYIVPNGKISPFNRLPCDCIDLIYDMLYVSGSGSVSNDVYGLVCYGAGSLATLCSSDGNIDLVTAFMADFDFTQDELRAAFIVACSVGCPRIVRALIEAGLESYEIPDDGCSSLDVLTVISEYKVDIGAHLFRICTKYDNLDACKMLLERLHLYPAVNACVLYIEALKYGSLQVLRHILSLYPEASGGDVLAIFISDDTDAIRKVINDLTLHSIYGTMDRLMLLKCIDVVRATIDMVVSRFNGSKQVLDLMCDAAFLSSCRMGYYEAVMEFINYDVTYRDGFIGACANGHHIIVSTILEYEKKNDKQSIDANTIETVFSIHTCHKYPQVLGVLLETGLVPVATINDVFHAQYTDSIEIMNLLFAHGWTPDIADILEVDATDIIRALILRGTLTVDHRIFICACRTGDLKLLNMCLPFADINGLCVACIYKHTPVVKILLQCMPDMKDMEIPDNVITRLAEIHDIWVAGKLISLLTDVKQWNAAFISACKSHNIPLIKLLVDTGYKAFNAGLAAACEVGDGSVARLMIHYGATDKYNALAIARSYRRYGMYKYMIPKN